MYGGRVMDSYDRRVSCTYMDEYFGDFLFDEHQPFHFYKDAIVDYVIPPEGNRDDYLQFIEELPLVNGPEIFGLHSNAEIGYFTQAVKGMWKHLIELQPQTDASTLHIFLASNIVFVIIIIIIIWQNYDVIQAQRLS